MRAADYDMTYDRHPELKGKVDFIITGRGWDEYPSVDRDTINELPVYFNPMKAEDIAKGYPLTVVNHKADVINKTGVNVFYEDKQAQAALLKLFCPKCKIVVVKEGVEAE